MEKIKMMAENDVTFSEGCDEYILDCKARENGLTVSKLPAHFCGFVRVHRVFF